MSAAGQTQLGELLAAPSASRLAAISACLIDRDAATRLARWQTRGPEWLRTTGAQLRDYLNWAAWMRDTLPTLRPSGGFWHERGLRGGSVPRWWSYTSGSSAIRGNLPRQLLLCLVTSCVTAVWHRARCVSWFGNSLCSGDKLDRWSLSRRQCFLTRGGELGWHMNSVQRPDSVLPSCLPSMPPTGPSPRQAIGCRDSYQGASRELSLLYAC